MHKTINRCFYDLLITYAANAFVTMKQIASDYVQDLNQSFKTFVRITVKNIRISECFRAMMSVIH